MEVESYFILINRSHTILYPKPYEGKNFRSRVDKVLIL